MNIASVSGVAPSGAQLAPVDSNRITVPVNQTPALTIVKSSNLARVSEVGATITYTFTVANTGNVTLTDIAVADPKTTAPACLVTTLDPGKTTICTSTKTVTQADLDAGSLANVATVRSVDPNGDPITPVVSNTVVVAVDQKPSLSIVKSTGTNSVSAPGAIIDYTFVVTNTGNVTLSDVGVTDPNAIGISCPLQTLAPAQSTKCVGTHTVTATDLDSGAVINVASVSGTAPDGTKLVPTSSNPVTVPAIASPGLTIVKSASETSFTAIGDVLHYSLIVTNIGNVTMRSIAVTDPKAAGLVCPASKLGAGTSMICTATHTVSQTDLDAGSYANVAAVTGTPPNGAPLPLIPSNTLTIDAVVRPSMTIVKVGDVTSVSKVGETINYTFAVTNTGNVTLSDVVVTDEKTTKPVCLSTKLAPGEKTICKASRIVTQLDLTAGALENTATVEATVPLGSPSGMFTSNSVVVPAIQKPGLSIVKSTTTTEFTKLGEVIPYVFVVTNTGNVPVSSITVADPIASPVSCPATILAPGESMTCTATHEVTQEEVTSRKVTNVATAGGTSPLGAAVGPVISSEVVTVAVAVETVFAKIIDATIPPTTSTVVPSVAVPARETTPTIVVASTTPSPAVFTPETSTTPTSVAPDPGALKLDKVATSTYSRVGDIVTYGFTLTNVGGSPLRGAEIIDTMAGLSKVDCGTFDGTLAQGASASCTATYVVTLADVQRGFINNTADAIAVDAKSLKVLGNSTARSFISTPPSPLAFTGTNAIRMILFALWLAVAGAIAVRLARKRTR